MDAQIVRLAEYVALFEPAFDSRFAEFNKKLTQFERRFEKNVVQLFVQAGDVGASFSVAADSNSKSLKRHIWAAVAVTVLSVLIIVKL